MKVYKFRDCFLNTLERQVVKNGVVLDLTPKAFDVLQVLVESGGEIVTKDELLGKVWNGNFVEEGNLAVHISRLRDQLGHTKNERYIETVSGTGYRFVALPEEVPTGVPNGNLAHDSQNGHISESGHVDSESYRHYLKGKYLLEKRTADSARKSIRCFQDSLSCDPTSVLASAGIVESLVYLFCIDDISHLQAKLDIDPILETIDATESEVDQFHVMLSEVKFHLEWDFVAAERHIQHALELNANCLRAHTRYCELLIALGRKSEALKEMRKMMTLDPLSVIICKRIGRSFYRMGRYEEAVRYLNDAIDLEADDYEARALLGAAYLGLGRYDSALAELNTAFEIENDTDVFATIGFVQAMMGNTTRAYEIIERVQSLSKEEHKYAIKLSRIFGALNEKERALHFLRKAYEYHDADMTNMMSDPRFAPLRDEPEFVSIAQEVGLLTQTTTPHR